MQTQTKTQDIRVTRHIHVRNDSMVTPLTDLSSSLARLIGNHRKQEEEEAAKAQRTKRNRINGRQGFISKSKSKIHDIQRELDEARTEAMETGHTLLNFNHNKPNPYIKGHPLHAVWNLELKLYKAQKSLIAASRQQFEDTTGKYDGPTRRNQKG